MEVDEVRVPKRPLAPLESCTNLLKGDLHICEKHYSLLYWLMVNICLWVSVNQDTGSRVKFQNFQNPEL